MAALAKKNCLGKLLVLIFHLFEAGIDNTISSLKKL